MPTQYDDAQEYKALQGQVTIDEALGIVEAFVAGIGNKDSVGDIIVSGAFNESLKRRKPRVVWGHNWNEPIGKVLEIYEVPASDPRLPMKMKRAGIGGVYARVQFNLKSERGRQAFADVSFFGEEQEWSIGYKTLDADFDPQRQANILRSVELYEVSPVLHGANQLTGTISIKADEMGTKATVGQQAGTVGSRTGAPGATAQGSQDAVDHDGDGMIYDGTPQEQRVPYKRQSAAGGKYEQERRRYVRGQLRAQGIKPNARVEDRSSAERDARARARAAFDKQTVGRGAQAQAEIGRANTDAARARRNQAQSDRLTGQAERSSAADRKPADRIDNSPPNRRIDSAERVAANRGTPQATDAATRAGQTDSRRPTSADDRRGADRTDRSAPNRMPDSAQRVQANRGVGNSTGGDQPVRAGVGTRPDRQSTGGDQPVRAGVGQVGRPVPSTGGDQPVRAGVGRRDTRPTGADDRRRPDSVDRGSGNRVAGDQPVRAGVGQVGRPIPSTGGDQPVRVGVGTRPDRQSTGGDQPVRSGVGQVGRPIPRGGSSEGMPGGGPRRNEGGTMPSGSPTAGRQQGMQDRRGRTRAEMDRNPDPGFNMPIRQTENNSRTPVRRTPNNSRTPIYQKGDGYGEDDGVQARNPMMGRQANLPYALSKRFGGAVRVRESDANSVVFDHRGDKGQMTLRVSYHFENGEFMFGDPTRVKPQTVYLNMNNDNIPSGSDAERRYEDRYGMDEDPQIPFGVKPKSPEKADPLGGIIPQEIVTAQTRGYGPRRGNLEKLLRYWRPIMKKPGGFRRCRVILANHPELYPLSNICAWLHHETTGLWPNEGCHHPGMKNCKKKLKGIRDGSIWSDSQWNERLANLGDGKSLLNLTADELKYLLADTGDDEKNMQMMEQFAERLESEGQSEPDFETDDEEKANEMAYMALRKFMDDEPEFVSYMTGDDNWVMEGEDDDDQVVEKPFVRGDKDDCGCGGGGEGHNSMIASIVSALSGMMKQLDEDIEVKAGRVLSTRNMNKLRDAYRMLEEVINSGGMEQEQKDGLFVVQSDYMSVYEIKSLLDPVLDYYGIEALANEDGVELYDLGYHHDDAIEALTSVIDVIENA
jgi:HK97 family phage prohead protease